MNFSANDYTNLFEENNILLGSDILAEQLNSSIFNNFAASSNISEESLKNILPDHLTVENDELRKENGNVNNKNAFKG
jgi:hypothetical protein